MASILCIDTAWQTAHVGLCTAADVLSFATNEDQKNHAAFLQPAIRGVMQAAQLSFSDFDAVAVVNGPGSYTGLRVGLSSAKGICYAAAKPLLLLNTLEVMALAAIGQTNDEAALYVSMIDARRNEVFTAVYDAKRNTCWPPGPLVVEENSFSELLQNNKMYFFGSGSAKTEQMINHPNASFVTVFYGMEHINELCQEMYNRGEFSDIAYAEPFYVKEFYTLIR